MITSILIYAIVPLLLTAAAIFTLLMATGRFGLSQSPQEPPADYEEPYHLRAVRDFIEELDSRTDDLVADTMRWQAHYRHMSARLGNRVPPEITGKLLAAVYQRTDQQYGLDSPDDPFRDLR